VNRVAPQLTTKSTVNYG